MKLKCTYNLIAVIVVGLAFASDLPAQNPNEYITEGKSFGNIKIEKSTINDAVSIYGKNYELINHKGYSYEFTYRNLGLSFYVCQADRKKKIFSVEFQSPFKVTTSKGIVLGESTLEDVFRIYGEYGERANSDSDQKGVFFFVEDEISSDQAYQPSIFEENSKELELHKAKKIKRINLVGKSGLLQCDGKFGKLQDK